MRCSRNSSTIQSSINFIGLFFFIYFCSSMRQRMSYAEQLKHPLWKEKASFIRERDNFKCVQCGAGWKELHIHHISPLPFKLAWEYPDYALETLCEDCHAWETMYQRIFY